jgi:hypothetical protein
MDGCATMERCVPKDCTDSHPTLPKRLGERVNNFFSDAIRLKSKDKFPLRGFVADHLVKVGMAIASDRSALLT